jgi:peptide/nickel transport system permease protein
MHRVVQATVCGISGRRAGNAGAINVTQYLVRRGIEIVPTVLIVTIFVFVLMRVLPGDPITAEIGAAESGMLTEGQRAELERQLGLDKPWPVQYLRWLQGVVTGDWGRTITGRQQITDLIEKRAWVSLQVGLIAWATAMAIAVPIGIISALRRNSWLDVSITSGALAGLAAPNFVVALVLIVIFGVHLQLLPTRGFVPFSQDPGLWLRHLILPVVTLATAGMATITRQTRSAMLEVMREDYVRTAQAKGLSRRKVVIRHTLRNALLPIVTLSGLQIGNLISGAIIVETVFGIPGMGRLTIDSVLSSDYQTIQILVLVFAVATILGNLLADVVYSILDPRIRLR